MTSDNKCIIGCFQLKNENPMCEHEHPAHQVNVSRMGFCVRRILANIFGTPCIIRIGTPSYHSRFTKSKPDKESHIAVYKTVLTLSYPGF